ncbi:MAG: hypothetical protein WC979_06660 [Candidatus Pacearchaeota archaeon]|jgi:hypothetical protein
MKKGDLILMIILLIGVFSIVPVFSDENSSIIPTVQNTSNIEYPASNYSNISEITNTSVPNISISLINIIPRSFNLGDTQISIRVQNNDQVAKKNLAALVSGKGFATYDVIPIDILAPGERDYILLLGNFREAGNLTLTIRIDDNVFKEEVSVIDQYLIEQQNQEAENKQILANLSVEFLILKQNYTFLENYYYAKKEDNYDVSKVSLDQLKIYIRAVDSSILNEDIKNAKSNLKLASDEYVDQKTKLDSATTISIITRFKENAVFFSAIAGAIITFFALSELLKRKSENLVQTINRNKDSKLSKKKRKK